MILDNVSNQLQHVYSLSRANISVHILQQPSQMDTPGPAISVATSTIVAPPRKIVAQKD
jgi:hypothetical protein